MFSRKNLTFSQSNLYSIKQWFIIIQSKSWLNRNRNHYHSIKPFQWNPFNETLSMKHFRRNTFDEASGLAFVQIIFRGEGIKNAINYSWVSQGKTLAFHPLWGDHNAFLSPCSHGNNRGINDIIGKLVRDSRSKEVKDSDFSRYQARDTQRWWKIKEWP